MLNRFLPRNERFFDYFAQAARVADQTAQALLELVEHFNDVERKVRAIRDLEHQGDEISRQVSQALTQTFVTPIDREDIIELSGRLDDFIDTLEEAARRMWLYRVKQPTLLTRQMAQVIARQARLLAESIPLLAGFKRNDELLGKIRQVEELEDEGDALMDQASSGLFEGVQEVHELVVAIRWGELYQYLEDATDRAQDVARSLKNIVLKHA
ncbi:MULTISPECIES: DUF47 domain-containing protein [unclassified Meiothermus]|uniref:DUF47 domain-containing protein n=1 Tax=unclassified Meiothermus TaxID=370471 RepID=UPI000D7C9A6C|nr:MULTISPECIES: DUF47 family protein [unclassified Meiothermus]PZA08521.1 DUF47 domain-containing protein [Meiothermus sp. Pnk-1]RYM36873.1 DUF47 domain-containing protein [Meiothermus sp. PNK-Is4]